MTTAELAYRDSLTAAPSTMAGELQALLGQRLVAHIVGTRSPKTVGRWASGSTEQPAAAALGALRSLYRVALLLRSEFEPDTVRAWLASPNPQLGEEIPAELLRRGEPQRVLAAAQHFLNG